MNIIFLDIDGVLNHKPKSQFIDDECFLNLKKLVRRTHAKIVLTSSWRDVFFTDFVVETPNNVMHQLKTMFDKNRIQIIGKTEHSDCRTDEIKQYIESHNIDNYVIIDDRNLFFDEKFVRTDPTLGFTKENMEDALIILQPSFFKFHNKEIEERKIKEKEIYDILTKYGVLCNPRKQYSMLPPKVKLVLEKN